jgi:hypothetical protein
MSKVLGKITGADKALKASKRAASASRLTPFEFQSPFGESRISQEGLTVGAGPGAGLIPGFEGAAGSFLNQLSPGAGQLNLSPDQAFQLAQQAGTAGAGFTGAAGGFLEQLQNFDRAGFEQTQFDRLNALAARGEETAATRTATSLLGRGRLGADTATEGAFRGLEEAQQNARTQRGLQAIGLGQSELQSLLGGATGLANTGAGLNTASVQNLLGSIGAGTGVGGFQSQFQQSLLNQALGATGGIQQAQAPTFNNINALLAGSGLVQGGNLAAANFLQQGGQAAANAQGSLVSGLLGTLSFGTGG